mmetsp:Transcript_35027/g.83953  ORF Transcript_35027/g.83953 Transcript_35027/m.83953 type:complete len:348 (-) Transcript_35027:353-1396(-)
MDKLLRGITSGDAVQRQLGQHALVPVPPPQQRHRVREDLLRAHGEQPLADALVLGLHVLRHLRLAGGVLPGALGAVLALHQVLGRPRQRQQTQRLQLQQPAELQQGGPGGGEVRGVEQHGVSGLQLRAEDLQQKIRADDRGRKADLVRVQLLQHIRRHPDEVLLAAVQQRARGADRLLRRELGGLREDQHGVLLLELRAPGAQLLHPANAGHAQADTTLVQLRIDHAVVHRHCQHANQEFIVIDGLLHGFRLGLDLHCAPEGLAVGICLGRAQHVLHQASMAHLPGHLCSIEERRLHEVLVGHNHLLLVPLPQPLLEAFLVLAPGLRDPLLHVHHRPLVCLLRPRIL